MLSRHLLSACLVLSFAASADGQGRRRGREMKPQTEPFAAEGTIHAVALGQIQILTHTNQPWMIYLDPKAAIHVVGTAEADFLRPGMFIQFTAEFDRRNKSMEKVPQLTIFTPTPQVGIGFWPEDMVPSADMEQGPPQAGGGFGEPGGRFGAGAAAGQPPSSVFTVHGQIRGIRKGILTVHAGRGMFQIELAEQPQIRVDFADYSVARKDDKISITRGRMFAGRLGMAQAQQLTITLSEPLTLAKKQPRRTVPRQPSRRPDGANAQPEPFGGR